jgi:hypothetical protein
VLWILKIAEESGWGGIPVRERPWILQTRIAAERFLAALATGEAPDVAWMSLLDGVTDRELVRVLSPSPWAQSVAGKESDLFRVFAESLRRSVQTSVMEGQGCVDRVDACLRAFDRTLDLQVERELATLPTRALQPLYLCILPAVAGLIGAGVYFGTAGL